MTRTRTRVGPQAASAGSRELDVDALLDDPRTGIIVCCGSGGVGKTTTSAALALRAAERGRKVVVLTIDPARRLAQSMGIEALDNTPRPVAKVDTEKGGNLDAMMLDMKRTFDEVVESQATPEKAKQILENPFYIALSSSFAGTQEYMAMEKLGQIHADAKRDGTYDLIVVDTPPSRSALDFLDAPERLSSFLDGRFIRLMLMPARGPAKLMTAGFSLITNALTKLLGGQVLTDLQTFVSALDTVFGGFRQRAQKTYALLQADGTAFLVVAAPEPDALREAAYFVERLSEDRMPLAGLIVNRASPQPEGTLSADEAMAAAARLRKQDSDSTDRRTAAAACGPVPAGRAGGAAARPVRGRPPSGGDRCRTGSGRRRTRPRGPAKDRKSVERGRVLVPARGGTRTSDRCARAHHVRRSPKLRGSQAEAPTGAGVSACSRAVSRTARHEAFGRRRSRARRSRSVMPPQTPHSIWLSSASARHSVRTGQPVHSCLALFCSAPRTKSWSGCEARHAALGAQSSTHMMLSPHRLQEQGPRPHDATEVFYSCERKLKNFFAHGQARSSQSH